MHTGVLWAIEWKAGEMRKGKECQGRGEEVEGEGGEEVRRKGGCLMYVVATEC